MTKQMIHHDFRSNGSVATVNEPTTKVALTASVLAKGRRLAALNNGLHIACVALCGVCIGTGVWILANLMLG